MCANVFAHVETFFNSMPTYLVQLMLFVVVPQLLTKDNYGSSRIEENPFWVSNKYISCPLSLSNFKLFPGSM